MAVFRINKTENYTVMSNTHLKERDMSLKAKGLLSVMLSLPDNWDYSIAGLTTICLEKESAIKAALDELKAFGYLTVQKLKPDETESGRFEYVYNIFEQPTKQPSQKQGVENQGLENLGVENQPVEIQGLENPGQLSTKEESTNLSSTNSQSTKKKGEKAAAEAAATAPDFSGTTFSPEMIAKVEDWLQYKKERRDSYKPTGLKALISEIQNNVTKYGEQAVMDLIGKCMAANYQGIIFDKLSSQPPAVRQAQGQPQAPQGMPTTNNEFARLRQKYEGGGQT